MLGAARDIPAISRSCARRTRRRRAARRAGLGARQARAHRARRRARARGRAVRGRRARRRARAAAAAARRRRRRRGGRGGADAGGRERGGLEPVVALLAGVGYNSAPALGDEAHLLAQLEHALVSICAFWPSGVAPAFAADCGLLYETEKLLHFTKQREMRQRGVVYEELLTHLRPEDD